MALGRWSGLTLVVSVVALVPDAAQADSMKCGTRIARRGDRTHHVSSVCGEPDEASQRVEYRTVQRRVRVPCHVAGGVTRCHHIESYTVEVVIDEWTYDFGSTRFVRYLTFEQGRLLRIETGGYGEK